MIPAKAPFAERLSTVRASTEASFSVIIQKP